MFYSVCISLYNTGWMVLLFFSLYFLARDTYVQYYFDVNESDRTQIPLQGTDGF